MYEMRSNPCITVHGYPVNIAAYAQLKLPAAMGPKASLTEMPKGSRRKAVPSPCHTKYNHSDERLNGYIVLDL